jgi:hypothetical protein
LATGQALDQVHPVSQPYGQSEARRSPKPAFNGLEVQDACVDFPIFAIFFHSQFAGLWQFVCREYV